MRTFLLGSTGLVGSKILHFLNECKEVTDVSTVSRRIPNVQGDKINAVAEENSDKWVDIIKKQKDIYTFISALGTTRKAAGNKEEFVRIDHGITYAAAKAAKEAGVHTCVIVTSLGASSLSPFLYLNTKGKLEDDIIALKFPRTIILRPGMLLGERGKSRSAMEDVFMKVGLWVKDTPVNFVLSPSYDEEVAKAAVFKALEPASSAEADVVLVCGSEINRVAKQFDSTY